MTRKTASQDLLGELHAAIAKELKTRVESGTASAADLAAAIKFLKDNGIEAVATPDSPMAGLMDALENDGFDVDQMDVLGSA